MTDSFGFTEPISLWEFCDTLEEIGAKEQEKIPFDADELLKQLHEQNPVIDDDMLALDNTCGVSKNIYVSQTRSESEPDDKNIAAELSSYHTMRSNSSDSDILTVSPVAPPLPLPTPPLSLPTFTTNPERTSAIITGGLIAQLPPMFRTKLDCPRAGGCGINSVKSLPGGSSCKGRDAIGSKHKFSCLCGLKWQENNWRERERLTALGEVDVRCIQYLPTHTTSKRKQSSSPIGKTKK